METILAIAAEEYDVGPGAPNAIALEWAADRAVDSIGVQATKEGIRKLNAQRNKFGLIPVRFPFGHRLF